MDVAATNVIISRAHSRKSRHSALADGATTSVVNPSRCVQDSRCLAAIESIMKAISIVPSPNAWQDDRLYSLYPRWYPDLISLCVLFQNAAATTLDPLGASLTLGAVQTILVPLYIEHRRPRRNNSND